jgi:hypothetical protein
VANSRKSISKILQSLAPCGEGRSVADGYRDAADALFTGVPGKELLENSRA